MNYQIRYIESGVDVITDSYLLDMLLETDKTTLTKLSEKYMRGDKRVIDENRAYIGNRRDYAYTYKTVECDSFEELFEKYNKILHKGARIYVEGWSNDFIVMQQGMKKRDSEIEYWETNYKTSKAGEFLTVER